MKYKPKNSLFQKFQGQETHNTNSKIYVLFRDMFILKLNCEIVRINLSSFDETTSQELAK